MGTGKDVAFGAPTFLPTGREPRSVVIADFDGDGALDVATAPFASSVLSVLRSPTWTPTTCST